MEIYRLATSKEIYVKRLPIYDVHFLNILIFLK